MSTPPSTSPSSNGGRPAGGPLKETERVQAGPGPGRGPFGGGMVGQKALDFGPSAKRLVTLMRPDRGKAILVVVLGIVSVVLMSIGPRILGHATDLVFNGFIGRQIPPGTPESDLPKAIQGMDVVPGRGVDFTAVAHVLLLVLTIYVAASDLIPEVNREDDAPGLAYTVFGGLLFFVVVDWAFSAIFKHS